MIQNVLTEFDVYDQFQLSKPSEQFLTDLFEDIQLYGDIQELFREYYSTKIDDINDLMKRMTLIIGVNSLYISSIIVYLMSEIMELIILHINREYFHKNIIRNPFVIKIKHIIKSIQSDDNLRGIFSDLIRLQLLKVDQLSDEKLDKCITLSKKTPKTRNEKIVLVKEMFLGL